MTISTAHAWELINRWVRQKVARRTGRGHLSEADGELILQILEQAQLCWQGAGRAPVGRDIILPFVVEPSP